MNPLDKIISIFSPSAAVRRMRDRQILSYYEAGRLDKQRKQRKEKGSGDSALLTAGSSLREQARHLDQNHDLSRGLLNTIVQNVIGPYGIGVEPMPRNKNGDLLVDFAKQIDKRYRVWSERPEVTLRHDRPSMERLLARSWLRDGDVFSQIISGNLKYLTHGTSVPLSIEMIESDMVPYDYNGTNGANRIIAGIELNAWKRAVAYHMYKEHPGDFLSIGRLSTNQQIKRVDASNILHLMMTDSRIGQTRGTSIFAALLGRLDDIKDYEESERIAAKVAASMAAYIKKGTPDVYDEELDINGDITERDMKFRPGLIFDDLRPGEEIGTIDTTRPNTGLESYRNGQLRALAAGSYITYSSLSRNYDGTYSAQRQELVEGWASYGVLASEFISQFTRPCYKAFINAELMHGGLLLPSDIDPDTIDDALFLPPHMPWIDPSKEAKAYELLERNGHASGPEIIRRRGLRPDALYEQEKAWRDKMSDIGPMPNGYGGKESAVQPQTQNSNITGATNGRKIG